MEERNRHFQDKINLLVTIPGVDRLTASSMIAEIGGRYQPFSNRAASRLLGRDLSRQ
jgi:hypothetical protein